jgi:hypothetical protein
MGLFGALLCLRTNIQTVASASDDFDHHIMPFGSGAANPAVKYAQAKRATYEAKKERRREQYAMETAAAAAAALASGAEKEKLPNAVLRMPLGPRQHATIAVLDAMTRRGS